ncbi:DUF4157 domain-containing protein [Moorena sp. SIO3I6]|uniref:eCIS core domain-containing protein n=1 Tax=Moorena sp. SIO3I6 TaxID=2607831 RepID=UPI0025F34BD9|nr:DUF4157 domain-containing protein [Moorena sp. SIO3I6]
MRTTHTYKPKYSHSTSLSNEQKKKDERRKGIRERLDAEEREWNAEEAVGEWESMSAKVMRTLESGVTQPERGRRVIGLQPKLTIGKPGDKYEQEADRVARQVVQQIISPQKGNLEGEVKGTPIVKIQRKALTGGIKAPRNLEGGLKEARGRGKPLSETIRHPLEQAMGADFSGVRVHTDARADQLNKSIQAKAFTTGQDVFFRKGAYQPRSRGGQELIAHELTHVVQQRKRIGEKKTRKGRRLWMSENRGSRVERRGVKEVESLNVKEGGGMQERKKSVFEGGMVQRMGDGDKEGFEVERTEINLIYDDGDTKFSVRGQSGNSTETLDIIKNWSVLEKWFNKNVGSEEVTNQYGEWYSRHWSDCAEPNALALLIKEVHDNYKGRILLDKHLFEKLYFEKKANRLALENELVAPCDVCKKWVGDSSWSLGLKIQW